MGMQCAVCGKKPVTGRQYTHRGKAKYLGGVGTKITGISKRVFKPNLQRIRVIENGQEVKKRVCVQCIRCGKVERPTQKKPFHMGSV